MTDIAFGATTRIYFNTEDPTGALVTLAGSPAVAVRNAAGTDTTDGVTLAVDSGGTGQHKVTIDTSANPTFYATASAFVVVITAGTVGGVSAVGDFVGEFSIGLLIAASVVADVGITQTGADKVWASATRTLTSFGTVVADIWAAATRTLTAFAFTPSLHADYDAAKTAASPAQVATELATYDAPTKAELDAAVALLATAATLALVKAKTDLIPAAPAAVGDIPTAAQNADKLLGRTRAGGADGGRTVSEALAPLRNKVAMTAIDESAGTATMTVYADDDTTPLYTYAVSLTTLAKSMTALDPTA